VLLSLLPIQGDKNTNLPSTSSSTKAPMVYSDAQLLQALSELGMIPIVDGRNPAPAGV